MATLPLFPSLLMDVYKGLRPDGKVIKKEAKFRTVIELSHEKQCEVSHTILSELFAQFGFDEQALADVLGNVLDEWMPICKDLERKTWTYDVSRTQILWYLWGYCYAPLLGRRVAAWKLDADTVADSNMPGNAFWYLPHLDSGTDKVRLPVEFVLDWWFDLVGPEQALKNAMAQGFPDDRADEQINKLDSLFRSLGSWRNGSTLPTVAKIDDYFSDEFEYTYANAIALDECLAFTERCKEVVGYIENRGLTDEHLSTQIPMSSKAIRIAIDSIQKESVDDGNDTLRSNLLNNIAVRYSAPSPEVVRQRLKVARLTQYGYKKLLQYFCPGVDERCLCPKKNKLWQLSMVYQVAYNSTIASDQYASKVLRAMSKEGVQHVVHPERIRRSFEHKALTQLIPNIAQKECLLALMPENDSIVSELLANRFTTRFEMMSTDDPLEDLWIDEAPWEVAAMQRLKREEQLQHAYQDARKMFGDEPSYSALQAVDSASIICSLAANPELSDKALDLVLSRAEEIEISDSQRLELLLVQLARLLNEPTLREWDLDTNGIVQSLLHRAQKNKAHEKWEAVIFQYSARHLVACNEIDAAESMFKDALDACDRRNYGAIRGEIAWNGFACLLANRRLNPKNHEKYFRNILEYTEFQSTASSRAFTDITEVASAVRKHFWRELYRPYPGLNRLDRVAL